MNASLHQLQQRFRQALSEDDSAFADASGIDIYRRSIKATTILHLEVIYPVCLQLVGQEFFAALALAYGQHYPSQAATLIDFGMKFSDFLVTFPPVNALPYLTEMAAFEWAWHKTSVGVASTSVDLQYLSQLPEAEREQLQFRLQTNSYLLQTQYPVQDIWQSHQPGYTDKAIDLTKGGDLLFLWQQAEMVLTQKLSPEQFAFLNVLSRELDLKSLCLHCEETQLDLARLLPYCLQQGWIILKEK